DAPSAPAPARAVPPDSTLRPTAAAVTAATALAVLTVREAPVVAVPRGDLPDRLATAPVMLHDIECSFLSGG
ncbi:hypothetical protein, partial [Streptomyces sp. NPDC050804]|uniref:hypothetical protein n=1 Tax=Streptomyces sp. NPDC050804 TaxID=3154745 RepID=UPI003419F163